MVLKIDYEIMNFYDVIKKRHQNTPSKLRMFSIFKPLS